MNGLFLLDRSLLDHHIVGIQNKDRFCMWVWMLAAARWKPQPIFVQGKEIILQRGQLFVSIRKFAEVNNVTKGVAERFIRDLKCGTMIETASETGGTIVTICNYENYQDFASYRRTSDRTANETVTGQRQDIKEHQITPDNTREEKKSGDFQLSLISDDVDQGTDLQQLAFSRFQQMAEAIVDRTGAKFPRPNKLTATRRKHLAKRLEECDGLEGWEACLRKIANSGFLSGREKDFAASFDWVVNPANFNKIMDGNYDRNRTDTRGQSLANARAAFLANGDD